MINAMLEPFSPANTELMLGVQDSIYGQVLTNQVRYGRYLEIPEGLPHHELPTDRRQEVGQFWVREVLDADADNLQHHPFTAAIGQWACRFDALDEPTAERVTRALLVHDVKEARFTASDEGDLTYDEAHAEGAEGFHKEHRELGEILRTDIFPWINDQQAEEIEADMNDGKRSPPETLTGQYIEIAERIGYVHAGTTAGQEAYAQYWQPGEHITLRQHYMLAWMAENCYGNSLERLIDLAPQHPSVDQFLSLRTEDIEEVMMRIQDLQKRIWDCYLQDGKDALVVNDRRQRFGSTLRAWDIRNAA